MEEIELLFKKPWHQRADVLHYIRSAEFNELTIASCYSLVHLHSIALCSCACLVPQAFKSKCQRRIQRRLPVTVVSSVDGEDNEQLLSLASSDSVDSGLLADHEDSSSTLNGSVQGSETVL